MFRFVLDRSGHVSLRCPGRPQMEHTCVLFGFTAPCVVRATCALEATTCSRGQVSRRCPTFPHTPHRCTCLLAVGIVSEHKSEQPPRKKMIMMARVNDNLKENCCGRQAFAIDSHDIQAFKRSHTINPALRYTCVAYTSVPVKTLRYAPDTYSLNRHVRMNVGLLKNANHIAL